MDYLSLLALLALLAPAAYLLWRLGGSLLRRTLVAACKMVACVALTGLYMKWLYAADSLALSLLWLLAVCVVDAFLIGRATGLRPRALLAPTACALFATVCVASAYVLWLVVRPAEGALCARWLVPVSAVVLLCSQGVAAVAVAEYRRGLMADRARYEYLLGNGASHAEAVLPFLRRAVGKGLSPLLGLLGMTGVGVLPAGLVAMMLGGMPPLDAALLLMAVVLGGLSAAVMSACLALYLFDRRAFDVYGRLKGR